MFINDLLAAAGDQAGILLIVICAIGLAVMITVIIIGIIQSNPVQANLKRNFIAKQDAYYLFKRGLFAHKYENLLKEGKIHRASKLMKTHRKYCKSNSTCIKSNCADCMRGK